MVNHKSLSSVSSRDNSSNLLRARASNSSHLRPNSPHQRSNSTGKAEMIYAECFLPCNSLNNDR